MKATVLGIQNVNYTKKTGEPCSGVTLHICFKDGQVRGDAVDSPFINDNLGLRSLIDSIQPGSQVNLEYNRRGYISDVAIL